MTAVGYVVKSITLKIGATDYKCAIIGAVLTPAASVVEWTTACPDGQGSDVGVTKWTLDLDYAYDPAAASLSTILADTEGTVAVFEFTPDVVNNPTRIRTGSVRIIPGPEGGTVDSLAQSSVSLPLVGAPTWKP